MATMKGDYETRLQAVGKEANAWKERAAQSDTKFKRSQIAQAITNAVIDPNSGVEASALPDILERAYKTYTVEDNGDLVAKDGEATIYGGDGSTPLAPKEWVAKLKDTAPYFFKNSTGGGGNGNGNGKALGGMSAADFQKLPAAKRLELAHTQKA